MEAPPPPASSLPATPPEPDDAALVRLAQAGDRGALDTLVRRHHAEVARLLWRFARRHADLEDLVQEVFLRVVRHLDQWRAEQPFDHWLRRITVNLGRDYCRRQSVRRRWQVDLPADDDTPAPEAVEPGADPAARSAAREIKDFLAQLPADDRTLLTLHYLEGWDFAQIGQHLGWSRPVTKLRAFRARRRLLSLFQSASRL